MIGRQPGRVQELLRKNSLDLRGIRVLVLDEADRMLDMGFEEPIREIIGKTPAKRQTLLFSATYPEGIRAIAARFLQTMKDYPPSQAPGSINLGKIEEQLRSNTGAR